MAEAATGNISVAKTRRILKLKKTPALGLNISPGPPPAPGPAAPAPAAPAPAAPAPAAPPPSFLPGVQPVAAALPPVAEYIPSAGSVKLFLPSEPYLPPEANLPAQVREVELGEDKSKNPCEILYDPCTKEPIATLEALEKRIRDIKKQRDIIPVGLYGLTNDTSNFDFLTKVFIDPKVSLDDMVSFRLSAGGQVGSDIYEVLSRLFVFFGGIENVNPRQNGNYKFMKKIEGDAPEVYDDSVDALKRMKCKATRAMGISDITLMNVRNDKKVIKPDDPYCEVDCDTKESDNIKTYLISVKWYKDEKNAEHYDLEKLFTAAQKITTAEQKPLDIIVFLKSKKDFEYIVCSQPSIFILTRSRG